MPHVLGTARQTFGCLLLNPDCGRTFGCTGAAGRARSEVIVVRRGPVNGGVIWQALNTEIDRMKNCLLTSGGILLCLAVVAAIAYGVNSPVASPDPALPAFEFHREGADSPEDAAKAMFLGIAKESPNDFVRHVLLGVCDGPIGTLQNFAECLHETKFIRNEQSLTVYDLPKGIDTRKPIHIVAIQAFDVEDEKVKALWFEMPGTFYGKRFVCVDVAAEGGDGLNYQTRLVVAEQNDRWYAMPRCRSGKSFYEIADRMQIATDVGEAK